MWTDTLERGRIEDTLLACFVCHVCLCDRRKSYDWTIVCTKIKSIFHAFVLTIFTFFKTQNPDVSFFYFNLSNRVQSFVQIGSVGKTWRLPTTWNERWKEEVPWSGENKRKDKSPCESIALSEKKIETMA